MAEPLKNWFDASVVAGIAQDLRRAGRPIGDFEEQATDGLADLELLDRGRHVGRALRAVLPADGARALDAIVAILGPELGSDDLAGEGHGMTVFRYLPHVVVIGELGPDHLEEGLRACYEVTKRFTAEWCVRPLVERHEDRVLERLAAWVTDDNVHVRRLVSEGLRPRLPWARRLKVDVERVLPLLTALRDDPAEYVRRSVANHLNDLAKDDPDRVVALATSWWVDGPGPRRRLIRHALRHLVKRGHPGALAVLGFEPAAARVEAFEVPAVVALGDTVPYTFELVSGGDARQRLVVDVVVGFRKARGQLAPKVFKLATVELGPGERVRLGGKVHLRDLTTRRHYPGVHTVAVQVNGAVLPGGSFEVQ
jgi:3-methyladenine DNA glycosylase AlkC